MVRNAPVASYPQKPGKSSSSLNHRHKPEIHQDLGDTIHVPSFFGVPRHQWRKEYSLPKPVARFRTKLTTSVSQRWPKLERSRPIVQSLPRATQQAIPPEKHRFFKQIHHISHPALHLRNPTFCAIGTLCLIRHSGLRSCSIAANPTPKPFSRRCCNFLTKPPLLIRDNAKYVQICSSKRAGIRLLRVMT